MKASDDFHGRFVVDTSRFRELTKSSQLLNVRSLRT